MAFMVRAVPLAILAAAGLADSFRRDLLLVGTAVITGAHLLLNRRFLEQPDRPFFCQKTE